MNVNEHTAFNKLPGGLYAVVLVASVLMGLVFAKLPVRLQQPGLISLWLGIALGSGICLLVSRVSGRETRLKLFFLFIVGGLAAATMTGERYRTYRRDLAALYLGNSLPEALPTTPGSMSAMQELTQDLEKARLRVFQEISPFPYYLKQRLDNFGSQWPLWAWPFWIAEILLAGGVTAAVVHGFCRRKSDAVQEQTGP